MSGGHWNYLRYKIEEHAAFFKDGMDLLAAIEHTLDWGIAGDTCYDCAKEQTIAALEAFFDAHAGESDKTTWEAVMRDDNAYRCARHKEAAV